jgi:hypothetical protein
LENIFSSGVIQYLTILIYCTYKIEFLFISRFGQVLYKYVQVKFLIAMRCKKFSFMTLSYDFVDIVETDYIPKQSIFYSKIIANN